MKNNKIFVIAEAGSNWKSNNNINDLKRAKKLIELASKLGADAVKFQTYRAESVYVENSGKSNYLKKSGLNQNIFEIFKKHSMPYDMIPKLANYCKTKKIMFMSTPFSVDDAKQLNPYVKIHKIASFEINHIRLLEYLASTKKPIILSTGASTYQEIDFAIKLLKKNKSGRITIMHTISKYPAPSLSLNLRAITELKNKYDLPIGFSDHSLNPSFAPLLAIGLGATIIEKHFTLNKKFKGPDHNFALNPSELKKMINAIRESEIMLGVERKFVSNYEKELQNFAKRSIQAITKISVGEKLVENENFSILRPGNNKRGAEPRFLNKVKGKKAKRNIKKGDGIQLIDCL